MIANFINSEELRTLYHMSFSYRDSFDYYQGLTRRLKNPIDLYPLNLPLFSLQKKVDLRSRGNFRKAADFIQYFFEYGPIAVLIFYRLYRLFKNLKPDILHINNGGFPGALSCRLAAISARMAGVNKICFVVNNMAVEYKHPYRWIDLPVDLLVSRCVDLFVTGSTIALSKLRMVLKLSSSSFLAIPNGVSVRELSETKEETLRRLGVPSNKPIFGVIGVMEPRKGHQFLLESLKHGLMNNPETHCPNIIIEGEGGIVEDLRKFVLQSKELQEHVYFIGSEVNIFNIFNVIDVLVYPSIVHEDFPNVISEAMAMKKPIVATRVAGASDQVLDGITGYLVPLGSKSEMWGAISKLAADSRLRIDMGFKGFERYRVNYQSKTAVTKYIEAWSKF